MERHHRFVLFSLAILIFAAGKGHAPSREGGDVAFLPSGSSEITVRVKGLVKSQGVYMLPKDATLHDVILLTGCAPAEGWRDESLSGRRLEAGDIVILGINSEQHLLVNVERMKAREAILLGIPLEPDRLDVDDWVCLPGVGPQLARRIMLYRQYNGDFGTAEALKMVPGVGLKKYYQLSKFFPQDKTPISNVKNR